MWCHNCQQWGGGRLHARGPRIRLDVLTPKEPVIVEENLDLGDINKDLFYFKQYRIEPASIDRFNIQWERSTGRIHYPIRDVLGNLLGGQLRAIELNDHSYTTVGKGIKFLTWRKEQNSNLQQIIESPVSTKDVLVITEDFLSSVKIVQSYPCHALPLLTTSIQVDTAMRIVKRNYDTIIVWLDNDSELVHAAADKIVNLLQLLGCKYVTRATKAKEPKKMDAAYIQSYIEAVEKDSLVTRSRTTKNPEVPF